MATATKGKPKKQLIRGITPPGMCSFPQLYEATKISKTDKGDPKYRITLVWKPKEMSDGERDLFNQLITNVNAGAKDELLQHFSDDMQAGFLNALNEHADKPLHAHLTAFRCLQSFDKRTESMIPLRSPFKLGKNEEYYDDDAVFVRLSTKNRPEVVDQGKQAIAEDSGGIYAGAIVRASYIVWPYNDMGNMGVTLFLGNVQKVAAGTRIGGGPSASSEFDEIETKEDDVAF